MSFVGELQWRGMIHDIMPGTEEQLGKEMTTAYVGFDPTADSLHIGHLVSIMILKHLQAAGHKPIALVGGATGMVGDPSGKSEERKFLTEETLQHNLVGIKKQLASFLDFDCGENSAEIVNNYDWFKDFSLLGFLRDAGKHLTVNYMMSKDSVKKRLETGISFTEFSYQLIQGYDFYHLNKEKNCKLQMGGSDQWGNITTGTEFIRRLGGGEAYALTCPLLTKSDGSKFGKSEGGNIWLDPEKTSPYKFYQFWLNQTDEDALKSIKIFTMKTEDQINTLATQHAEAPHTRVLQNALADDIMVTVHSKDALDNAKAAAQILFGKTNEDNVRELSKDALESIGQEVPKHQISKSILSKEIGIIDLLSEYTPIFGSKGEARRALKNNAVAVNKTKVQDSKTISFADVIQENYILVQNGKKNYHLINLI
ncbi:MAG: tyrosine--tRNA ligase [Flavobacteriales bacterium]|nr:tyrosine--tRNA ligase [Flavobacteriales bacterium]|tara:strand:+ start:9150 stop:10424 length:1275 start_codon:yes stop_codon:yes gene_type:complete